MMGNFAGYIYSQEERMAQQLFFNAIVGGAQYKAHYGKVIYKAIDDLWEAMKSIKDNQAEKAETTIRNVYKRFRLEPEGRDNWFCYDLADRIVKYAGKEPQIMYEE